MKWDGPLESLTPKSPVSLSPPSLQFVSGSMGSTSPSELESLPPVQISPTYQLPTAPAKKRKSAAMTPAPTASGRQPRGKKISHNVIEKRYRSNLNDKIAKLRDSVPELRSSQGTVRRRPHKAAGTDSEGSGDEGNSSGLKFNKATVLTKATEYIQQLERQNQRLMLEVTTLRKQGTSDPRNPPPIYTGVHRATGVSGYYSTAKSTTAPIEGSADESSNRETSPAGMIGLPESMRRLREEAASQAHYAPEPSSTDPSTSNPPTPHSEVRGLIPIPDDFRRFREQAASSASQEHYAPTTSSPSTTYFEDDGGGHRWSNKSRAMSRILIGSLAGLMVMEGFSEKESGGNNSSSSSPSTKPLRSRGLFSLPTELLTESRGFRAPIRQRIINFAASPQAARAVPILFLSAVFFTICFIVFLYLTPSESKAVREGDGRSLMDAGQQQLHRNSGSTITSGPLPSRSHASHPWLLSQSPSSTLHSIAAPLSLREHYAKQAVSWLGLSWLTRLHHHDEEATVASRVLLDRGGEWGYGKRWRGFWRLVPKMLEGREGIGS